MISPERNEVDISKLFEWSNEITLEGFGDTESKVYMRLIGDSDWNIARVKALRASGEMRKKLHDVDSDERLAYIPDKNIVEKESVIMLILALRMKQYRDEVSKSIILKFPREPKADATLEEQEKYQKEIDTFEDKRLDEIESQVRIKLETDKKKLKKISFDKIYREYEGEIIQELCEAALNRTFLEYSVFFGTYLDEELTKKTFDSFEDFSNSPTELKTQLLKGYANLDIGIYELKK